MTLFLCGIAAFVVGAIASLPVPARGKQLVVLVGAVPGSALVATAALRVLASGAAESVTLRLDYPIGAASLTLDPLSAVFALVVAIMGLVCLTYAGGYLRGVDDARRTIGSHWLFLVVLIASMLLVLVARHVILFLVFWETMTVASFFLVFFENEKEEVRKAALNYFVTMHAGLFFLVVAFVLLAARGGGFGFDSLARAAAVDPSVSVVAFLLLFAGFGIKAGFVPLHSWLPQAHPAAPSHVSALMSGVMIKIGIYGIIRSISLLGPLPVGVAYVVLAVSGVSALLGVIYAIAQHDLKRLLAYHSVENIGIIGLGIGLGLLGGAIGNPAMSYLGYAGALLHVVNHSIFKGLLFYGAGTVYLGAHTRTLDRLGGLVKAMPVTSALFLVGAVAISGLPPLNGFASELVIYFGLLRGIQSGAAVETALSLFSFALLAGVGALAVFCFTKVFGVAFLGQPRTVDAAHAREASALMLAPMALLALLCLLIGLAPGAVLRLLAPAAAFAASASGAAAFTGLPGAAGAAGIEPLISTFTTMSALFGGIAALSLLLFGVRRLLLRGRGRAIAPTWGCGYDAPTPRMQYTASSYARTLLEVVSPLFKRRDRSVDVDGLFPVSALSSTHREELLDAYVVRPVAGAVRFLVRRFTWIQSGNLQQYILYGLAFLVVTVLWILGVAR